MSSRKSGGGHFTLVAPTQKSEGANAPSPRFRRHWSHESFDFTACMQCFCLQFICLCVCVCVFYGSLWPELKKERKKDNI